MKLLIILLTLLGDGPTAVDDQYNIPQNSGAVILQVLLNDNNFLKGDAIISVTQPGNGTVIMTESFLTYQANAGYCNSGSPTDDFTYTLNGGSTATVSVTVVCGVILPQAQIVPINQWQWILFLVLLIPYIIFRKLNYTAKID